MTGTDRSQADGSQGGPWPTQPRPIRIALLTLPSVMSDATSLGFLRQAPGQIVHVGLSNPNRAAKGGICGQLRAHLHRSGPRMLAYLALGFAPRRRGAFETEARLAGAPVHLVNDINGPAGQAALREARPDLIVTLHFDQILAPATIALAPMGGVNLHPSLLPLHRGPVPAFWALLDKQGATGVTVHRLAARIDAGEVLAQRAVPLPAGLSALEAARRLHLEGLPLLCATVAALADGTVRGDTPDALPYRPFPDAATLRAAARCGVRLVLPRDLLLLLPGKRG